MNPIRLVIIEDEPLAAERLQKQVEKLKLHTQILAVLESVSQAQKWFSQNPSPDLVLSDIQLGDGISFQIFEKQLVTCPIVFTTSYDEFAIRAFKVQSIDYLLKPIKQEELENAFQKFLIHQKVAQAPWQDFQNKIGFIMSQIEQPKTQYKERFLVKQADQLIPIATHEIAYFFTRNDWVCLCTHSGKQHIVDLKLDELGEMLDPKQFFRLNRQFISSSRSIQKAYNHLNGKLKLDLLPSPEDEVFISREKAQGFKSWWEG